MHSLIKTALVAAVGVAVAAASPAFAAKSKRGENVRAVQGYQDVYAYAPGYASPYDPLVPAPFWSNPANVQIVAEYLKDTPMHNGNAF